MAKRAAGLVTKRSPSNLDDPGLNVALARGLSVLRAFSSGDHYLGNMELVRRTGIPKATVSRMTYTLYRLGYLNYRPGIEKYSISPGVLDLAYSVFMSHGIHVLARPLMQKLAEETQSTVGLGVRDGMSLVFLEYAKTRASATHDTAIGFRVPISQSTMGWSCLAVMNEVDRLSALEQLRKEAKRGTWPEIEARIQRGIEEVWERGFCISFGDMDPQNNAVGAPFVEKGRSDVYAVNVVGPRFQFSKDRMIKDIGPRLLMLVNVLRQGGTATPSNAEG